MNNYRQFRRYCKVMVTPKAGGAGWDMTGLRCVFGIEKALKDTPNYAQIAVTNPAPGTVSAIKPGDFVVVIAGYDENFGMIYSGEIVQTLYDRDDGTDTYLTLVCEDGDSLLNKAYTAKTLSAGSTNADVLAACLGDAETGTLSNAATEGVLIRAKTVFGRSSDALRQIADSRFCQFYVEDGKANIIAAQDIDAGLAFELNPDTGLIGAPKQEDDGVSAKCLLNPSIRLNSVVHISDTWIEMKAAQNAKTLGKTKELNPTGDYRVIKLKYSGDTHGEDWFCEITAVAQDGKEPAAIKAPTPAETGDYTNESALHRIGNSDPIQDAVGDFLSGLNAVYTGWKNLWK